MGAFFSFTCGHFATRGGMAAELGKPANQDLFIGIKEGGRRAHAPLKCLPFFGSAAPGGVDAADFVGEQAGPAEQNAQPRVLAYKREDIQRRYGWATDRWETADFAFSIYTPFGEIADPEAATAAELRRQLLPAVLAELEVDNRSGRDTRTAIFAVNFNEPGWRPIAGGASRGGFGLRRQYGILGEAAGAAAPTLFCRWSPEQGVMEPGAHLLGSCPGLAMEVPPGERRMLRLALGCYLEGIVTTGLEGRYLYTKYFGGLEDVLHTALDFGDPAVACAAIDARLRRSGLSEDQQFLIAHATRGYYGSTQLLEVGGEPFWVVNEGEYCMMNTLDLSVDHMFWELEHNPWVVKNLLGNFVRRYRFMDRLKPGGAAAAESLPGGISFTHDMGVHNNFSPPGESSYELADLPGVCFSHMTAEQLCNWVLMGATYVSLTEDAGWASQNGVILEACLESLQRRGGNSGIPEYDSSRCGTGAEITTYDSLDHSLAQTRNSLYMAVKFWAACLGLAIVFERLGDAGAAERAREQMRRVERTVLAQVGEEGVIPAVFEKQSSGYHSRILPAAEGLLYPWAWGHDLSRHGELVEALRRHASALLKDPAKRNLFPDGGIRLSSTSNNSWQSKIAIFMHVARQVLHLDQDPDIAALFRQADIAHAAWQTDGSGYWACSDQFINGKAIGSRYYPRVITTALWMRGNGRDDAKA
ncbi:MAG TPA: glycoside hydrolase family 52 protein [Phycisphaerae bacterium]|nr:glycoside hydrolase family 52 protein [Phycisphaerae bacterium]